MLEPLNLPADQIIACIQSAYALALADVTFLPLGADVDTAVYRVTANDGTPYFLKLRRGHVSEAMVVLPHWLAETGVQQLIAPIPAQTTGALVTPLHPFTAVLYPFVDGCAGWHVALSAQQWREFGGTLRALHTSAAPAPMLDSVPHETYSAHWREQVRTWLQHVEQSCDDSAARGLVRLLQTRRETIQHMIDRAQRLADLLAQQPRETCLCHGDIHAGNILIDSADRLYVVDWDTLVVAPKEHDLMFIGGGVGGIWNSDNEATWFYQGYGQTTIDHAALAYYRYERIVQDIAVTCAQLLATGAGGADRPIALDQLSSQFAPDNVVDIAYRTDALLHTPPR